MLTISWTTQVRFNFHIAAEDHCLPLRFTSAVLCTSLSRDTPATQIQAIHITFNKLIWMIPLTKEQLLRQDIIGYCL